MKKIKSLKDLEQLMESLGAVKDEEPGFTSWTLDCGPGRQAPSDKPQATSAIKGTHSKGKILKIESK